MPYAKSTRSIEGARLQNVGNSGGFDVLDDRADVARWQIFYLVEILYSFRDGANGSKKAVAV